MTTDEMVADLEEMSLVWELQRLWLWWSKPFKGIPFWLVGEFTTHFRAYFSGDWDVHWGYWILTHCYSFFFFFFFFFFFKFKWRVPLFWLVLKEQKEKDNLHFGGIPLKQHP